MDNDYNIVPKKYYVNYTAERIGKTAPLMHSKCLLKIMEIIIVNWCYTVIKFL